MWLIGLLFAVSAYTACARGRGLGGLEPSEYGQDQSRFEPRELFSSTLEIDDGFEEQSFAPAPRQPSSPRSYVPVQPAPGEKPSRDEVPVTTLPNAFLSTEPSLDRSFAPRMALPRRPDSRHPHKPGVEYPNVLDKPASLSVINPRPTSDDITPSAQGPSSAIPSPTERPGPSRGGHRSSRPTFHFGEVPNKQQPATFTLLPGPTDKSYRPSSVPMVIAAPSSGYAESGSERFPSSGDDAPIPASFPNVPPNTLPVDFPTVSEPEISTLPPPSNSNRPSPVALSPSLFQPSRKNGVCQSSAGDYGSHAGIPSGTSFAYVLQTKSTTQREMMLQVLPALETAFVDFLLPILFTECSRERRQAYDSVTDVSFRSEYRRRLNPVGISAQPDDYSVQGAQCGSDVPVGACWVMMGEVTLHVQDESQGALETETIRNALRRAMDHGLFDEGVHESIVRVAYVDVTSLNTSQGLEDNPSQSTAETSTQSDGVSNHVLIGCVLAAAGTLLVLGLVLSRHRRRQLLRQQAARGDPVGSGPPSPILASPPVIVDPLADRKTVVAVTSSPGAESALVLGDEEVQSEASIYMDINEAAQACLATPTNLPLVPFLDGLCGDTGILGVTTVQAENAKDGSEGEAADDAREREANHLASPTDDSVYLEGASPKDYVQGTLRFM